MEYIQVKNWDNFQHYKDRTPPWIKLYNHLLDDFEFSCLPDASKAHLLSIWLLASRTNNKIPNNARWIGNKINATEEVNLNILIEYGFIELISSKNNKLQEAEQDASIPLQEAEQDACLEREREKERKDNSKDKLDWSALQMSAQEIKEIKQLRRNAKAVVTQRVINELSKQFEKSRARGYTNEDILLEWSTKGWRSYKDEWMKAPIKKQPLQPPQEYDHEAAMRREIEEFRSMLNG